MVNFRLKMGGTEDQHIYSLVTKLHTAANNGFKQKTKQQKVNLSTKVSFGEFASGQPVFVLFQFQIPDFLQSFVHFGETNALEPMFRSGQRCHFNQNTSISIHQFQLGHLQKWTTLADNP